VGALAARYTVVYVDVRLRLLTARSGDSQVAGASCGVAGVGEADVDCGAGS
jgi:hypothetical protein